MAAIFEIVNEDYELVAIPNSGGIGDPAKFQVTVTPAEKMQLSGKKALVDQITWTVNPGSCTMPGFTHTQGAQVNPIKAPDRKCKADQKPVLLKLDKGDCTGSFTNNANPSVTATCSCKIMIKNAGQDKVKGE